MISARLPSPIRSKPFDAVPIRERVGGGTAESGRISTLAKTLPMRVSIMFRPQGEAPERAAALAAVLEGAGHEVTRVIVEAEDPAGSGDADVIHAVGSDVGEAAATAAGR